MDTANAKVHEFPRVGLICNRSVFSEELMADTNHKAPCALPPHEGVTNHINHRRCEDILFQRTPQSAFTATTSYDCDQFKVQAWILLACRV